MRSTRALRLADAVKGRLDATCLLLSRGDRVAQGAWRKTSLHIEVKQAVHATVAENLEVMDLLSRTASVIIALALGSDGGRWW
jgi:hypothetical protein